MGMGYKLKCDKCRHVIDVRLGGGFLLPSLTEETIGKMKSGAYGEKARKFFQENPDGTVDCAYVLLRCDNCGNLKTEMDLSLYKRKEDAADDDGGWLLPDPEYFVKSEDHDHICEKCGSPMRAVDLSDDFFEKMVKGGIRCPDCSGHLHLADIIMWD